MVLWRAANGPEILRILAQAQPVWLFAAVATLIGQTFLSAIRWKITGAMLGQVFSLRYAVKEYFMSQMFNQLLPGAIVGDAARALRARSQAGIAVSTQSVVLERLAGQLAMFITMACAFLVTWGIDGGIDWPRAFAVPIGLAISVGVALMVVVMAAHWCPKIIGAKLSRMLRPVSIALLSRPVLPAQIALGAVITVCNLTAFGLCAWAVGVALSGSVVFAIVPLILFFMLVPFTISGWGVREGAAALLLPLGGTSPSEAVAVSVLFGCVLLLAVLPGVIAVMLK